MECTLGLIGFVFIVFVLYKLRHSSRSLTTAAIIFVLVFGLGIIGALIGGK